MTTSFHEEQDETIRLGLAQIIGEDVLKTAMAQCANMPATPTPSLFADRILCEHPMFTPETAVASFVYSKLASIELLPAVAARLEDAVKTGTFAELIPMIAAAVIPDDVVKIAGQESDDNWAITTEAGSTYPLHSYASTVESATRIDADYRAYRLPAAMLKQASAAVMKAVARHEVETYMLPEIVLKHAHERLPDVKSAASRISARLVGMSPDVAAEARANYDEVFKSASDEDAPTVVTVLHELDRQYRIKYSSTQPDPLTLVYDAVPLEERVKQANTSVLLCDAKIPSAVFAGVIDRLPLGAYFDDAKTSVIKVASQLAARGEGLAASDLILGMAGDDQNTLGQLILKVA